MKVQATDKSGISHSGQNIKSVIICEENGTPLVIVKETIIGDLKNYKILTPDDQEFMTLTRSLGYDINLIKVNS